jgi:hypothetical protein
MRTPFQLCLWIFLAASSSTALPWHAYIRGSWRDVLSLLPPAGSCSKPELKIHSFSPGSLCACGRPHTTNSGRLFAVGPDVANLLAVVTMRKGVLGLIILYLDGNMAEAGQFEKVLGLCRPWQGNKKQEKGNGFGTIMGPTSGLHLFDAYDVKTEVHQPIRYVLRRSVVRKMV